MSKNLHTIDFDELSRGTGLSATDIKLCLKGPAAEHDVASISLMNNLKEVQKAFIRARSDERRYLLARQWINLCRSLSDLKILWTKLAWDKMTGSYQFSLGGRFAKKYREVAIQAIQGASLDQLLDSDRFVIMGHDFLDDELHLLRYTRMKEIAEEADFSTALQVLNSALMSAHGDKALIEQFTQIVANRGTPEQLNTLVTWKDSFMEYFDPQSSAWRFLLHKVSGLYPLKRDTRR